MKKYFLSIFLLVSSFVSQAQQRVYAPNTKVYVYSFGTLNLRDSATITSTVLAKLSFGDTVTVLENLNIKCTPITFFATDTAVVLSDSLEDENPIMNDLVLDGSWVKVKYKNIEGFVNGIYLSALPNFGKLHLKYKNNYEKDKINEKPLTNQQFYLLNKHYVLAKDAPQLKPAALKYTKKYNKKDYTKDIKYNTQYVDGLKFTYEESYMPGGGAGGFYITILKAGTTFTEAVVYARGFFYDFENINIIGKKLGYYYNEERKSHVITWTTEGGGCAAEIYQNKKGEWFVKYGCGGCLVINNYKIFITSILFCKG